MKKLLSILFLFSACTNQKADEPVIVYRPIDSVLVTKDTVFVPEIVLSGKLQIKIDSFVVTALNSQLSAGQKTQVNALITTAVNTAKNATIKILQDSLARLNIRLIAKEVYLDKTQFTITNQNITITQLQSLIADVNKLKLANP